MRFDARLFRAVSTFPDHGFCFHSLHSSFDCLASMLIVTNKHKNLVTVAICTEFGIKIQDNVLLQQLTLELNQ